MTQQSPVLRQTVGLRAAVAQVSKSASQVVKAKCLCLQKFPLTAVITVREEEELGALRQWGF